MTYRIGFGTDIHKLAEGRSLIIGGVNIESHLGADGHSDADVLLHAVTDALLGALALGDIGYHFPDTDERWKNAESSEFVLFAAGLIRSKGYEISNVDSVIELEKPRLRQYITAMRDNIASALRIDVQCINIKAKTGESIDAVGECRAVRAQAVVLLTSNQNH